MEGRMSNYSILIIEDDIKDYQGFANAAMAYKDFCISEYTPDSYKAMDAITLHNYDAIILDLELQIRGDDGITILKNLPNYGFKKKPFILVVTNNISTTIHKRVRELGADYILLKTHYNYCDAAFSLISTMIKDYIPTPYTSYNQDVMQGKNIDADITSYFNLLGISTKLAGYEYLKETVKYNLSSGTTCDYLNHLASIYKKNTRTIQSSMEYAIKTTWNTGDPDNLFANYTGHISISRGIPTLSEFLSYVESRIKTQAHAT